MHRRRRPTRVAASDEYMEAKMRASTLQMSPNACLVVCERPGDPLRPE